MVLDQTREHRDNRQICGCPASVQVLHLKIAESTLLDQTSAQECCSVVNPETWCGSSLT